MQSHLQLRVLKLRIASQDPAGESQRHRPGYWTAPIADQKPGRITRFKTPQIKPAKPLELLATLSRDKPIELLGRKPAQSDDDEELMS
jgi:hypothetical protein